MDIVLILEARFDVQCPASNIWCDCPWWTSWRGGNCASIWSSKQQLSISKSAPLCRERFGQELTSHGILSRWSHLQIENSTSGFICPRLGGGSPDPVVVCVDSDSDLESAWSMDSIHIHRYKVKPQVKPAGFQVYLMKHLYHTLGLPHGKWGFVYMRFKHSRFGLCLTQQDLWRQIMLFVIWRLICT